MAGKSNYLETISLRNVFKGATAPVSSGWISLHSATVTDNADGTEISTVGTNYNRITYALGSANWTSLAAASSASNSTVINKLAITFASAASSYTVVGAALWDTSAAGNLLYLSSITAKVIEIGDVPTVSSGEFKVSED